MLDINAYKSKKKELGITFEVLSQLSGVPVQTLHNIFRGHTTTPRIDTVQAIERALGLSPTFTQEETGQISTTSPATGVSLTEKEKRLLMAFNELIEEMQDYILESTEKLAAKQRELRGEKPAKTTKWA